MPVSLHCDRCGTRFTARPCESPGRRFCSRKCYWNQRPLDTVALWSERIGEPARAYILRRYIRDRATLNTLIAELGTGYYEFRRTIKAMGIPARTRSGAMAVAWESGHRDRKLSADNMRRHVAGRFMQFGRGCVPSPREIVMRRWLESLGVACEAQKAIKPRMRTAIKGGRRFVLPSVYHVDLYLPRFRAVVEVFGAKRSLSALRHLHITKLGMRVFYFPNRVVDLRQRDRVEQFVAALKRARRDPSAVDDEELVRWGYPEGAPILQADGKDSPP